MSFYDWITDVKTKLTESCDKLNSTDNVCGKVLVDGEFCGVEDGDGVEDDRIHAGELLEDHDGQAQDERMPDLLRLQLGEEGQGRTRRTGWGFQERVLIR